jgi:hypothetical protein
MPKPLKVRLEPVLLKKFKILYTRGELNEEEKRYYNNQEKGYQGEVQFDHYTEKLHSDCIVLNDLLLEIHTNQFQIDTLIIFKETIYLIDVKTHEGDYCYSSDHLTTINGKVTKNPVIQLIRSKSLFLQLLQELRFKINVEAFVIFINPSFTLYQAPTELPFIFPTQLTRFLNSLDSKKSQLLNLHKNMAEKLCSLHLNESRHASLPNYDYRQLKKGVTCCVCKSFEISVSLRKTLLCLKCGCEETVASAIMRCVEEVKLLFPEHRITTNLVHEWCGGLVSKKRVSRILEKNFEVRGVGQWAYYE